jgi:hypothetical protein
MSAKNCIKILYINNWRFILFSKHDISRYSFNREKKFQVQNLMLIFELDKDASAKLLYRKQLKEIFQHQNIEHSEKPDQYK